MAMTGREEGVSLRAKPDTEKKHPKTELRNRHPESTRFFSSCKAEMARGCVPLGTHVSLSSSCSNSSQNWLLSVALVSGPFFGLVFVEEGNHLECISQVYLKCPFCDGSRPFQVLFVGVSNPVKASSGITHSLKTNPRRKSVMWGNRSFSSVLKFLFVHSTSSLGVITKCK